MDRVPFDAYAPADRNAVLPWRIADQYRNAHLDVAHLNAESHRNPSLDRDQYPHRNQNQNRNGNTGRLSVIAGQTIGFLGAPKTMNDADPLERIAPVQIELRNGKLSPGGSWIRRPGMVEKWQLPSSKQPIVCLIPWENGIAITADGAIYRLSSLPKRLPGETLTPGVRPTWILYNDTLIIAGGKVVTIGAGAQKVELLGGEPPKSSEIAYIDSYVVLGVGSTGIRYSAVNTMDRWPGENVNFALSQGERIRAVRTLKNYVYIFKDFSTEVWANVGGEAALARRAYVDHGTPSGASVVRAANTALYFLGQDGDFWAMGDGGQTKLISGGNRAVGASIKRRDLVYGFDFRDERVIRWFCPNEQRTIVYDYERDLFSEDSYWMNGGPRMVPVGAYMELGQKKYIGDSRPTGMVYEWTQDVQDDAGMPIRVSRSIRVPLSSDGTTGRVNRLRLRMKRGDGKGCGSPALTVKTSLDEGDWVTHPVVDLGKIGERDPYVDLYGIGIGRELRVEMIETDAAESFVAEGYLTVQGMGR